VPVDGWSLLAASPMQSRYWGWAVGINDERFPKIYLI